MNDLRMIGVLWARELLRMKKEPTRLMGVVIQPLLFWLVIGSGFSPSFHVIENADLDYLSFFFIGIIAMVLLFASIFSTITLIDDRSSGFMQAVLVAPGTRFALVLGKILGVTSIALIQALLFMAVGLFLKVPMMQADWLLVSIFLFLGGFSMAGLGFVLAWLSTSSAAYHALMSVILIPMWILSGAMFPPSTQWMQWAVLINPIAWLVSGLRAAFAGGVAPMGSVTSTLSLEYCLGALCLFSLFCLWAGSWICRFKRI
ncbi:MAG: ABC transporter permease [Myxococcaceae bacterium]|nr:ABC transporter permease [Myxococcaceae bacterium]MBH2006055.1 ABC transporter permease [Myxococcaceae bacterium]